MERLLVCLCVLIWSARSDETVPHFKIDVKEDDGVVLPCSFDTIDITNKVFDWSKDESEDKKDVFIYEGGKIYGHGREGQADHFKGRVFHFSDQLTSGNASIHIRPTKLADTGNYTCYEAISPPTILSKVELTVGACPKPTITLYERDGEELLKCVTQGASPRPDVEIWDNAGNVVPADELEVSQTGDYYNISLFAAVTKRDYFHCVVKQKKICHQISSDKTWAAPHVSEPISGYPGWVVAVAVVITFLCVFTGGGVLIALLVRKGVIKLQCKKGSQELASVNLESVQLADPKQPLNVLN